MQERGLSNRCGLKWGALLWLVLSTGCARQLLPDDMPPEPSTDRDAGGGEGPDVSSPGGEPSTSNGDTQPSTGEDAPPPAVENLTDAGFTSGSSGGSGGSGTGLSGFMIPDFGFGDDPPVPELSDAAPKLAGDLVISELLPYPEGSTPHEWIELYNPTGATFDLIGCRLASGTGEYVIRSNVLAGPGSYVVLGQAEAASDGIAVLYTYDDANFSNSSDRISLECGDLTVDELSYTTDLTQQGQSIQLAANMLSATANDSAEALCLGTTPIGISQNQGTPGTVNLLCP